MNFEDIIKQQINASIHTKLAVLETQTAAIAAAGRTISDTLARGNKLLTCGNGGSASDAQNFATELLGRYVNDRRSLPAIPLSADAATITAIGNDYGYAQVFARQISSLGQPGDTLVAFTTSGNSENVIAAIATARERGMHIIALTGKGGGKLAGLLQPQDIHVCVPDNATARIQEAHIMILHTWCEIIERAVINA